jgi:SRSO17 transposase
MTERRQAAPTVKFVDEYCQWYQQLIMLVEFCQSTRNGIVAVTAYGLIEGMTFPLIFEVYKPKERLERGDTYRTKPEIAAILIQKLQAIEFKFKLVLADSLYGESDGNFVSLLNQLKLNFVVATWSNHAAWLPPGQRVRQNQWRKFDRVFSDGSTQQRYIR